MDRITQEYRDILNSISVIKNDKQTEVSDISIFQQIQRQRHKQRDRIMSFSLKISGWSTVFLWILIVVQAVVRIFDDKGFEIIDAQSFKIISSAVISQSFGIVFIITKALWNDKDYKQLLSKDFDNAKK